MPNVGVWLFDFPIQSDYKGFSGQLILVDECEINIIWKLGKEGPLSIYKLFEETYHLPSVWSGITEISGSRKTGAKRNYEYFFIYKKVKGLAKRRLITVSESRHKEPRIVRLTFLGMLVYLVGSLEGDKFKNTMNHHTELLPFSDLWDLLINKLGSEKVIEAFDRAIRGFSKLAIASFKVKSLGLEFEGFLRNRLTSVLSLKEDSGKERDKSVSDLLKSKELAVLRNSYIAFLAVNDIWKLRNKSSSEVKEILPMLDSEMELAYFEGRKPSENSLFRDHGLKEFLPKYAGHEYFLTGMFVKNLIWQEKDEKCNLTESDYQVDI
jgi:hypothetical protein